jgi:hypothetical protein
VNAVRLHLILTFIWAALFVPAVVWWKESVPFLVFVSVYANFVGHWASYEAAKAEREVRAGE